MKILVTGAAGFIGSHACERLVNLGYEVVGVDNFNSQYALEIKQSNERELNKKGISVIKIDLRANNLIKILPTDINYIFHFAALPGLSPDYSFEDYFSNNVMATKNLIDYSLSLKKLKLFINIGTSSIYGLEAIFAEDVAPKPASYYGITKLTAEQLVLQKSRENKINACSLRLYSVYGPRERPEKMFSQLIACADNEVAFCLHSGSEKHLRSFTYVDDIIAGIVSVITNEDKVNGEVINLGNEIEYSTKEGIKTVETVIGHKIKINEVAQRSGNQLRTKANIDKAKQLLNYHPKISLVEGVEKQVFWYKEHLLKVL